QVTQPVDQTPVGPDGKPVEALVKQGGTIAADGGRVVMSAAAAKGVIDNAINLTGVVRANTIRQENGVVVIGTVEVDGGANGNVNVSGKIDATGAGVAPGGTVSIKAANLVNNAGVVDVSGASGGTVDVSGAVVIHQGTLKADGATGDGGRIGVTVTQN